VDLQIRTDLYRLSAIGLELGSYRFVLEVNTVDIRLEYTYNKQKGCHHTRASYCTSFNPDGAAGANVQSLVSRYQVPAIT
jgi:hypothetical protein